MGSVRQSVGNLGPIARAIRGPALFMAWMAAWLLVPVLLYESIHISTLIVLVVAFAILIMPLCWLILRRSASDSVQRRSGGFFVFAFFFVLLTIITATADWFAGYWVVFLSIAILFACAGIGTRPRHARPRVRSQTPARSRSR